MHLSLNICIEARFEYGRHKDNSADFLFLVLKYSFDAIIFASSEGGGDIEIKVGTIRYFLFELIEEIERIAEVKIVSVVSDERGNYFFPFSVAMMCRERSHY